MNMNVGNKLRYKFENIQNLTEVGLISSEFPIDGTIWKILIHTKTSNDIKYLSLFLCHISDNLKKKKNSICEIVGKYRLLNQLGNGKDLMKVVKSCLRHDIEIWGFNCFIEWEKLILPENGYIENDSIAVEIDFDFRYYDFSNEIPNFTDIIVNAEDTDFHVNKWVLSSKSEYFYDLFVNKKNEDTVIQLDDIKATDLCYILASLDSSFDGASVSNYEDLIKIAIKFGVSSLHNACEQFLISETRIELIDKIKYFEEYGYEKLMKSCIESLKTGNDIKKLHSNSKFATLKETTKLRIMQRFLDIY